LGRLSQKGTKVTKSQNGDGELAELVLGTPKAIRQKANENGKIKPN